MARTLIILCGVTSFMLLMIKLSDGMAFSWSGALIGFMWGIGCAVLLFNWAKILSRGKKEEDNE